MREINRIIIHCAATKPSQDIGADEIREWHIDRGWSDIGYHYVIRRNGIIEPGRPITLQGAHAKGHNGDSIGICLVGGIKEDGKSDSNFTRRQWDALRVLVDITMVAYPDCEVLGHRDLPDVAKDCPCFDARAWWGG